MLWINLPGVWGVGLLSIYARSRLNSQTAKSHNTTKAAVRSTRFPVAVVPWQKAPASRKPGRMDVFALARERLTALGLPVVRRKRRPESARGTPAPDLSASVVAHTTTFTLLRVKLPEKLRSWESPFGARGC